MRCALRFGSRLPVALILLACVALASQAAAQETPTVVDLVYSTTPMERNAAVVDAAVAGVSWVSRETLAGIFGQRVETADKGGIALRLAKLVLLDVPIIHYADGLNHEFGHMARAEEAGWPLRFRLVGGPWSSPQFDLYSTEPWRLGLATFGGGFEAELVREHRLLDRMYEERRGDAIDAATLLDGALGRFYYVHHDLSGLRGRPADDLVFDTGDPTRYVYELVEQRGAPASTSDLLATARSIRSHAWLNLADAGLWAQAFNVVKYLWRGDASFDPTVFRIRGVGFTPFSQYHLSPVGPQTAVGTRYSTQTASGEVTVRWTDRLGGSRLVGSGLSWSRTSGEVLHPRFTLDVWRGMNGTAGARVEAGATATRWPSSRAALTMAAGAKSQGYVLGLPQKRGVYLQAGLRLKF